jgi:hypothetical protein
VLAAPELVIAKLVELLNEIEVATELQHRMLANRMMRGEESSEFQARHMFLSHGILSGPVAGYVPAALKAIAAANWSFEWSAALRAADGSRRRQGVAEAGQSSHRCGGQNRVLFDQRSV